MENLGEREVDTLFSREESVASRTGRRSVLGRLSGVMSGKSKGAREVRPIVHKLVPLSGEAAREMTDFSEIEAILEAEALKAHNVVVRGDHTAHEEVQEVDVQGNEGLISGITKAKKPRRRLSLKRFRRVSQKQIPQVVPTRPSSAPAVRVPEALKPVSAKKVHAFTPAQQLAMVAEEEDDEELATIAVRSVRDVISHKFDTPVLEELLDDPSVDGGKYADGVGLLTEEELEGIAEQEQARANRAYLTRYFGEIFGDAFDYSRAEADGRDVDFILPGFTDEPDGEPLTEGRSADTARLLLKGTFDIPDVEEDDGYSGSSGMLEMQGACGFNDPSAEVMDFLLEDLSSEEQPFMHEGEDSILDMNRMYVAAIDRTMGGRNLTTRLSAFEMKVFLKALQRDPEGPALLSSWHQRLMEDPRSRPRVKREIQDYLNRHIRTSDLTKIALHSYIQTLDEKTKLEVAGMVGKYLFNVVTGPVQAPVKLGIRLAHKESRREMADDVRKVFSAKEWKTAEQKQKFAKLLVKIGIGGLVGAGITAAATGVGAPVTACIVLGSIAGVGVAAKAATDIHAHKSPVVSLGEMLGVGIDASISSAVGGAYGLGLSELAGVIHESFDFGTSTEGKGVIGDWKAELEYGEKLALEKSIAFVTKEGVGGTVGEVDRFNGDVL